MDPETLIWYLAAVPALAIIGIVTLKVIGRKDPWRPPAAAVLRRLEAGESTSASDAIRHVREAGALAERLAARGAGVAGWMMDWAGFGCWSLTLNTDSGGEVLQAFWNGMERLLSFDIQPADPARAIHEYRRIHEFKVGKEEDPIPAAEEYLTKLLSRRDEPVIRLDAPGKGAVTPELIAFAERLAARDVVIAECRSFDHESWSMHLYNGGKTDAAKYPNYYAVRVTWKGESRDLSIAVSPLRPLSSPYEFETEFEQKLGPSDDAIQVAESYLGSQAITDL